MIVRWSTVLSSKKNKSAVVEFVEGTLAFKKFHKSIDKDARTEINKLDGVTTTRNLARRALRRRGINYSVNQTV